MTETNPGKTTSGTNSETLKGWIMVFLTLVFVVLYGLALLGKLRPLDDASMVTRLEPIIFIIVGYYFGRLPSQQNEQTLKGEIDRQTKRAEAAQHAKETALKTSEALEERVKNARIALETSGSDSSNGIGEGFERATSSAGEPRQRGSVSAALKILDS